MHKVHNEKYKFCDVVKYILSGDRIAIVDRDEFPPHLSRAEVEQDDIAVLNDVIFRFAAV